MQASVFHIEKLGGDESRSCSIRALRRLIDQLAAEDRDTIGVATLLEGSAPAGGRFFTCADHLAARDWVSTFESTGWATVLAADPASEAPLAELLGAGVVVASSGLAGFPLVDLEWSAMKRSLRESRAALSERVGYEVRNLVPVPLGDGLAVDSLVISEALEAGYRRIYVPRSLRPRRWPESVVTYRTLVGEPKLKDVAIRRRLWG